MGFKAILPKKEPVNPAKTRQKLEQRMRRLTADLQRECADYEVPSSLQVVGFKTVTRTSGKTGRAYRARVKVTTGYKRTNTLKRSWSRNTRYLGSALVGEVASSGKIAPYNKWVRGSKTQSKLMKARGWKTVGVILMRHWPAAKRDFAKILQGK